MSNIIPAPGGAASVVQPKSYHVFQQISTTTFTQGSICPSVALSNHEIAVYNWTAGQIQHWNFTPTGWVHSGGGLAVSVAAAKAIGVVNQNVVVTNESDDLVVYTWSGSAWTKTGNTYLTIGSTVYQTKLCNFGANQIVAASAQIVSPNSEMVVLSWNGTDFTQVGNAFDFGAASLIYSVDQINDTDVVVVNGTNLQVYRWDGTDFTQVGSNYAYSGELGASPAECRLLNSTDLLVPDFDASSTQKFYIFRWDASAETWSKFGFAMPDTTIAQGSNNQISILDNAHFVNHNANDDQFVTFRIPQTYSQSPHMENVHVQR